MSDRLRGCMECTAGLTGLATPVRRVSGRCQSVAVAALALRAEQRPIHPSQRSAVLRQRQWQTAARSQTHTGTAQTNKRQRHTRRQTGSRRKEREKVPRKSQRFRGTGIAAKWHLLPHLRPPPARSTLSATLKIEVCRPTSVTRVVFQFQARSVTIASAGDRRKEGAGKPLLPPASARMLRSERSSGKQPSSAVACGE